MLKLYGFDASNYVNMVKFALREKGLEFEQATLYPSQAEAVLSLSPMGKVPVLETGDGLEGLDASTRGLVRRARS